MAALAANIVSDLPVAHLWFQPRLHWNILLAQHGVPPAPFLWAVKQQVNEKALVGWQKQGLCLLFIAKGRSQTRQDKSTGRASEVCSEQRNKTVGFLIPKFNQVMPISEKNRKAILEATSSLPHTHTLLPGPSQSGGKAALGCAMLSSTETLDARHPHISQGWKRPLPM